MTLTHILPTETDLRHYFLARYGDVRRHGWRVRLQYRFGYFDPESWYELVVDRLVTPRCSWIDVGGGKSIFPHNTSLAETLCRRAALVVGVDPSDNIRENNLVHERAQCKIEDYRTERTFDLVTMRMVAEHIQEPEAVVTSLARLVRRGGKVVVYTPNRWSPVSLAASLLPFWLHHPITNLLWGSKEEDVFPTVYKMNTRKRLRYLFENGGFKEVAFAHLDNCSMFQRWRMSCFLEFFVWRMFRMVELGYPENNLLGVYENCGTVDYFCKHIH